MFNDPKTYLWENIIKAAGFPANSEPSINDVMSRCKVGRGTIQRIRQKEQSVMLNVLVDIADNIGVPIWELLRDPKASDPKFEHESIMKNVERLGTADLAVVARVVEAMQQRDKRTRAEPAAKTPGRS